MLLVVGTHGEVFPASEIPEVARRSGATVVEVARGRTDIRADLQVRGGAGPALSRLVDAVLP